MNKNLNDTGISTILMRLGSIGEAVSILPALRNLTSEIPESEIAILCEDIMYEIIHRDFPEIHHVSANRVFSTRSPKKMISTSYWTELIQLITKLRSFSGVKFYCFHTVEYWSNILKPQFVSTLLPYDIGIGFNNTGLPNWDISVDEGQRNWEHVYRKNLRLIKDSGVSLDINRPWIGIDQSRKLKLEDKLQKRHGLHLSHDILTCCPGAADPWRVWPAPKYQKLLEWILSEYNYELVFIGTEGERTTCEEISSGLPEDRVYNTAGEITLQELPELIDSSEFFLANDTGPLHIAVAREVPTVGLFGPGVLYAWASYDVSYFKPVYREMPEDPNLLEHRDDPEILRQISVDRVKEAVETLINEEIKFNH